MRPVKKTPIPTKEEREYYLFYANISVQSGELPIHIAYSTYNKKEHIERSKEGQIAYCYKVISHGMRKGFSEEESLANFYLIQGTVFTDAEAMGDIIKSYYEFQDEIIRVGTEEEYKKLGKTKIGLSIIYARRDPKGTWMPYYFSMLKAIKMGLVEKNAAYKTNPDEMLYKRNLQRVVQRVWGDVFKGMRVIDNAGELPEYSGEHAKELKTMIVDELKGKKQTPQLEAPQIKIAIPEIPIEKEKIIPKVLKITKKKTIPLPEEDLSFDLDDTPEPIPQKTKPIEKSDDDDAFDFEIDEEETAMEKEHLAAGGQPEVDEPSDYGGSYFDWSKSNYDLPLFMFVKELTPLLKEAKKNKKEFMKGLNTYGKLNKDPNRCNVEILFDYISIPELYLGGEEWELKIAPGAIEKINGVRRALDKIIPTLIQDTNPYAKKEFSEDVLNMIKVPKSLMKWIMDYLIREKIIVIDGDNIVPA